MHYLWLYVATVLIWGSTWLCIRWQIGVVPITMSIFYRFSLAALVLMLWRWWRTKRLPHFDFRAHILFIMQGFLMFSINYVCIYMGTSYLPSGLVALTSSVGIIFNILFSAVFFKTPIPLGVAGGASLGIIGMATIFWKDLAVLDLTGDPLVGLGWCLLSSILAAIGNITVMWMKKREIAVTDSNMYGMAYGALMMLLLAIARDEPVVFDWHPLYIFSLLHLAIAGSAIAFFCYLSLVQTIGPSRASYAVVLTSVMALGLSTLFEGFQWTPLSLSGVGLVMLGNILVLWIRRPRSLN